MSAGVGERLRFNSQFFGRVFIYARQQRRVPADARGPPRLHLLGRVGVGRPHRQDLGRRQRSVPADGRGPQRQRPRRRLLLELVPHTLPIQALA